MRSIFWLTLTFFVSLSITASAVELTSIDIGTAELLPGETVIENGEYTITAAGHDIWGNADGFRFAYLELSGDFDASVQIPFFNRGVDPWAKAGIMGRDTLDADSANFISTADESSGYGAQDSWRLTKGGSSSEWNLWENGGPQGFTDGDWVRLKREANAFTGFYHEDGEDDWIEMNTVEIKMDEPIFVGLIVTSHNQNILTTATFANFTVENADVKFPTTAVEPFNKLPAVWGNIKR